MFEGTWRSSVQFEIWIIDHLTSQQKAQVVATKDIICMLASS
jgi:hypothetical protein